MKILMVLDREFPPDTRVENEIEGLSEAGHEIFLACYTQKKRNTKDIFKDAIVYRNFIVNLIF